MLLVCLIIHCVQMSLTTNLTDYCSRIVQVPGKATQRTQTKLTTTGLKPLCTRQNKWTCNQSTALMRRCVLRDCTGMKVLLLDEETVRQRARCCVRVRVDGHVLHFVIANWRRVDCIYLFLRLVSFPLCTLKLI